MSLVPDAPAFLQSTEPDDSMELYSDNGQPVEDIDIDFDREETAPTVNDDLMLDDAKSDIEMPVETTTNVEIDEAMLDDVVNAEDTEVPEEGMEDDDAVVNEDAIINEDAVIIEDTVIDEDDEELLDFSDIDEPEKVTANVTITSAPSLDFAVVHTTTLGDELDEQSVTQLDAVRETSAAAEVPPQLVPPEESADESTQQSLHNSVEPEVTEQTDQVPVSAAPNTQSAAVTTSTQYEQDETDLLDDFEEDVQHDDPTERLQQNAKEYPQHDDPTERFQQIVPEKYPQNGDPTERVQPNDAEEYPQNEEIEDPELREDTQEGLQPGTNASTVQLSQIGSADGLIRPHKTDESLGKCNDSNSDGDTNSAAVAQDADVIASGDVETQAVKGKGTPTTFTGLHPVLCSFAQEQYPLFPLKTTIEGSEHFAAVRLLEDENLVHSSFGDLLRACRLRMIEEIGVVSELDELCADIEVLGLKFSEDSISSHTTSLFEILQLYLHLCSNDIGEAQAPPLELYLDYKPRADAQMAFYAQHISKGGGLSALEGLSAFYESFAEREDYVEVSDGEQFVIADNEDLEGLSNDVSEKVQGAAPPDAKADSETADPAADQQERNAEDHSHESTAVVAASTAPPGDDLSGLDAAEDDLDYDEAVDSADPSKEEQKTLNAPEEAEVVNLAAQQVTALKRSMSPGQSAQLRSKLRRDSVPAITISVTSAPRDDVLGDVVNIKDSMLAADKSVANASTLTAKSSVTDDGILSGVTGAASPAILEGDPDILDFTDDENVGETASSRTNSSDKSAVKRVRDEIVDLETTPKHHTLKRQKSS